MSKSDKFYFCHKTRAKTSIRYAKENDREKKERRKREEREKKERRREKERERER